ncbi:MAG: hypothetical protein RL756_685 [Pseudomonadota bacterium]|jgi:pyrimidine deaminase RibD-like protein
MTPTIDYGMPHAEYLAVPAMSASGIKRFIRSPAHFKAGSAGIDASAAAVGTATHMAVLEPARFDAEVVVSPKFDKRSKAGKAEAEAWAAAHAGRLVIDEETFDAVRRMADAVRAHPAASALLQSGVPEVSMMWADADTGVACKSRADWLRPDGLIVDLKTARDASPGGFARAIGQYGYALQAAWYLAGARVVLREEPAGFVFVAVEKDPPHAVGVYALDAASVDAAADRIAGALVRLLDCQRSGHWPAYSSLVETITAPAWAL